MSEKKQSGDKFLPPDQSTIGGDVAEPLGFQPLKSPEVKDVDDLIGEIEKLVPKPKVERAQRGCGCWG